MDLRLVRNSEDWKEGWKGVYAMTLAVFALIASEFMPVSLLSPIAADLHLTIGEARQAISATAVVAVCTSLLLPIVSGGVDRRGLLVGLLALLVLSGLVVASASNFAMLLVGRGLLGLALGGFATISSATIMRLLEPQEVGKGVATTNIGNAFASVIAAPVASYLGGLLGWRSAYLCIVPIGLLAMMWVRFALPPLPGAPSTRRVGAVYLLRQVQIRLGLASIGLLFLGQFGLYVYIRPFLEQVTNVSLPTISLLLLTVGCAGGVGTTIVARYLDRYLSRIVVVLPIVMAITAAGIATFGSSPKVVAVLLGLWGLVAMAAPIGWFTWITLAAPDEAEAAGGLVVATAQIAIMLGAALGGLAFDHLGAVAQFNGCAVILLFAAFVARSALAAMTTPSGQR